jgi:glycolate oxidase FAD binding subunit
LPSVSELESVDEASDVLRRASAAGTTVSIEREGGDVVLSTRRLDRMLEHEAGDLTCIVEAGLGLRELNRRLEPSGQVFALDPPGDPTLGACLAANLSGPRRHRYGTMRDLVLGVTVVLGDGTVASSGGRVVKNVAGYDLGKLFCGSEGRLGLIARIGLRLQPLPAVARQLVVDSSTLDEAYGNAQALLGSQLAPSAVDLLWPELRLAVMFEGGERAVARQLQDALALVGGREDDGSIWIEAAALRAAARGRLSFPPGVLPEVLPGVERAVVSVAAGVAYVSEPVPDQRDEALLALTGRIRAQFDPHGVLV